MIEPRKAGRPPTFHGLTAVASLKHKSCLPPKPSAQPLPRPNSRGLIEADAHYERPPDEDAFHGLTAVASLKQARPIYGYVYTSPFHGLTAVASLKLAKDIVVCWGLCPSTA